MLALCHTLRCFPHPVTISNSDNAKDAGNLATTSSHHHLTAKTAVPGEHPCKSMRLDPNTIQSSRNPDYDISKDRLPQRSFVSCLNERVEQNCIGWKPRTCHGCKQVQRLGPLPTNATSVVCCAVRDGVPFHTPCAISSMSSIARNLWPPFSQALTAALYVMVFRCTRPCTISSMSSIATIGHPSRKR